MTFKKENTVEIGAHYRLSFTKSKTVFAKCDRIVDDYYVMEGAQVGNRKKVQVYITNASHSDNFKVIPATSPNMTIERVIH